MCDFLSAVILKNGDIICDPRSTDSHEDLITNYNIKDTETSFFTRNFARLEFTPPYNLSNIQDLSTWKLKVDEDSIPDWFNKSTARTKLENVIKGMFVSDNREILLGGCYILCGDADVYKVVNSCIKIIQGNSKIHLMCNNSSVQRMCNNSSVQKMGDNSSVQEMVNNSFVKEMLDNSSVQRMWDTSSVEIMCNNSSVQEMYYGSSIYKMFHKSKAPKSPALDYRTQ